MRFPLLPTKPLTLSAFILILMVLPLIFGCAVEDQKFLANSSITNIHLDPMSGDLPGTWQSLEEEVGATEDQTPILSGFPGAQPPAVPPSDDTGGGSVTPPQTPPSAPPVLPVPPAANPPEDHVCRREADDCSDLLGTHASKIRVIHVGQALSISGDKPIALKVVGNQTEVTLNISGADGQSLPGLCVYAMGNQPKVTINLGVSLGGLFYSGRGNQSATVLQVNSMGSLLRAFAANLSGNLASLTVAGTGKHVCPTTVLSGNGSQVSCTPN